MNHKVLYSRGVSLVNTLTYAGLRESVVGADLCVLLFRTTSTCEAFIGHLKNNESLLERLPVRLFMGTHDGYTPPLESPLNRRICPLGELAEDVMSVLPESRRRGSDEESLSVFLKLHCKWLAFLSKRQNLAENRFHLWLSIGGTAEVRGFSHGDVLDKYPVLKHLYPGVMTQSLEVDPIRIESVSIPTIKMINSLEPHIPTLNDKAVVYCRHGWDRHANVNSFYFEGFQGDSPSFSSLCWWPRHPIQKQIFACNLVENALVGLAIADERLNSIAGGGSIPGYYQKARLYFVSHFNRYKVSQQAGFSIEKRGKEWSLASAGKPVDLRGNTVALLVHQGVLEKSLTTRSQSDIETAVSELKQTFPIVYVTSGRGRPRNVPANAKFVSLSDVLMCVRNKSNPDKLALIRTLFGISGEGA